jgi:hypothetical protein
MKLSKNIPPIYGVYPAKMEEYTWLYGGYKRVMQNPLREQAKIQAKTVRNNTK